ncbi:MAG: hypothetical protein ACR2P6_10900 [Gammaproteobacteria bacterium]
MLNISTSRFVLTFIVGFLVASNINWGIAEVFLNEWAIPRHDGFMRTGTLGAQTGNLAKIMVGFMLPLFVIAFLQASLDKPASWPARAVYVSLLVCLGAFYGTYTFISGWGNVNWWPLMVTATCDTVSMVIGALLIGYMQQRGSGG